MALVQSATVHHAQCLFILGTLCLDISALGSNIENVCVALVQPATVRNAQRLFIFKVPCSDIL